ncbi:MAG TPA: hypothetical protein VNP36_21025, partial [Burkholderiales bacterium]|nr:hypothetical protein [Burkholderiales bacterium]
MSKTIIAIVLAAGCAGLGYWLGAQRKHNEPVTDDVVQAHRKPLMPKYADEAADAGTISISPRMVQNLGVRTAKARSGSIEQRFEVTGAVAYNER